MDSIVTAAIVGTEQLGNKELTTGTPIDDLAAQLDKNSVERKLLLTAGAFALYRQAGRLPEPAPPVPEPAAPESLAACSTQVGQIIQEALEQDTLRVLLPETLQRLKQTHLRLPYGLLPAALAYGARSKEIRPLLAPVLGERGHWLSQFEKTWNWATQFFSNDILPDDAETIWQEGTVGQRRQLLEHMRTFDPTTARTWLHAVWKKEKAETRKELLTSFRFGLSTEDEAFLEQVLDDRSEPVRKTSAFLLTNIPASALTQRMIARADRILTYKDGTFSFISPTTFDKTWQRDGITELPKQYSELSQWYIKQIVALVPLSHWEERFAASPADLVTAARAHERMGNDLLESWSYAAMHSSTPSWLEPLWRWRCQHPYESHPPILDMNLTAIYETLVPLLPQRVAERYIEPHLGRSDGWVYTLSILPTPWSQEFGDFCLAALRTYLLTLNDQANTSSGWKNALRTMALSLPPTCFAAAFAPMQLPEEETWQVKNWQQELHDFTTVLYKRQRIMEEI